MDDIPQFFDCLYKERGTYYGTGPSDGLVECIAKYHISPCRTLDIGCGTGRNALWLAAQGYNVLAIDVSNEAVRATSEAAAHENIHLRTQVCNIGVDTVHGDKFGLVVAITTLNHIAESDLPHAYKLITDSLDANGILYCVVFTKDDPGFTGDSLHASECSRAVRYFFNHNELSDAFPGLEVMEYSEYVKPDTSHGPPHMHAKAKLVARKS